jgi:hypothetical protein
MHTNLDPEKIKLRNSINLGFPSVVIGGQFGLFLKIIFNTTSFAGLNLVGGF